MRKELCVDHVLRLNAMVAEALVNVCDGRPEKELNQAVTVRRRRSGERVQLQLELLLDDLSMGQPKRGQPWRLERQGWN